MNEDYNKVTENQIIRNDTPIVTESNNSKKNHSFGILLFLVDLLTDVLYFLLDLRWICLIAGAILFYVFIIH